MASIVDFHSVNLRWLINFKNQFVKGQISPDVQLLVANESYGDPTDERAFSFKAGDTIYVESYSKKRKLYVGTVLFGSAFKGEFPASLVSPKKRDDWTTEDIAEYVVKRSCELKKSIYLALMNKKDFSKEEFQGAFVSHARRCRFVDLVDALQNFFQLKQVDLSQQYVWLDVFCANQTQLDSCKLEETAPEENLNFLSKGLHIAIANFQERVMFLDKWDSPTTLTRAWCVWELFGVAKAKKQIEIALTQSQYDSYIHMLRTDYSNIITKLSKLDVEKATCVKDKDLKAIRSAIMSESSFALVNEVILSQLRTWVASTAEMQMIIEERKEKPNLNEIALLASYAGRTYQDQANYEKAEFLLRKALSFSEKAEPGSSKIAIRLSNLASLLKAQGKYDEAEALYLRVLEIDRNIYGQDHFQFAADLNNFASLLMDQGKYDEAKLMYEDSLKIKRKVLGDEDASVAQTLNNLAMLFKLQGAYDKAKPLYEEALRIRRKALGDEHPSVANSLNNLAALLDDQGDYDKAKAFYEESLKIRRRVLGDAHPSVAQSLNNLALMLKAQGKYDDAMPLYEESLKIKRKAFGNEHRSVAETLNNLGLLLKAQGKYDEAMIVYEESIKIKRKVLGDEHSSVAISLKNIAALLEDQGKYNEAKPLYDEALRIEKQVFGEEHPSVANSLNHLADLFNKLGRTDEAILLGKEALRIAEKILGKDHPTTKQYRISWE